MTALAPTLEAFFTDRLIRQRQASGHTVAAYRDTWRLLLGYAATRNERPPLQLDLADLNAPLIGGFLDHLEHERGNRVRTTPGDSHGRLATTGNEWTRRGVVPFNQVASSLGREALTQE